MVPVEFLEEVRELLFSDGDFVIFEELSQFGESY
jgi:hypothetical protein